MEQLAKELAKVLYALMEWECSASSNKRPDELPFSEVQKYIDVTGKATLVLMKAQHQFGDLRSL